MFRHNMACMNDYTLLIMEIKSCHLDHGDQASLTLTEEVIRCWFVTEMTL